MVSGVVTGVVPNMVAGVVPHLVSKNSYARGPSNRCLDFNSTLLQNSKQIKIQI